MVPGSRTGLLDSTHDATHDDSSCSLDVVVEHGIVLTISFQRRERILPIFELNDNVWPALLQRSHEFIEELLFFLRRDFLATTAHVERVLEEGLVAGSQIDGQREGAFGSNAGTTSVQSQLANGDTHASHTEISETEDSGAIGDDGDFDIGLRPILNDIREMASILETEIHAFGLLVDFGPSLASLSDGGGIDQRSQLGEMIGQESVEQVDIVVSEGAEVEKSLNVIGLGGQLCKASLLLDVVALCTRGSQTVRLEIFPYGDGEGSVVVGRAVGDMGGGVGVLGTVLERRLRAMGSNGTQIGSVLGNWSLGGRGGGHGGGLDFDEVDEVGPQGGMSGDFVEHMGR